MIESVRATFVRLAYPIRSNAFAALADSDEAREALAALMDPPELRKGHARAYVDAPFLHPAPSRFSDGTYGVLYAANTVRTAVMEKAYHIGRFFRDAAAPAQSTRQVRLALQFVGNVRDIRRGNRRSVPRGIYHLSDYSAGQKLGRSIRGKVPGVLYDSVRNADGGECIGAFLASLIRRARLTGEVDLVWDGKRFTEQHAIEPLDW